MQPLRAVRCVRPARRRSIRSFRDPRVETIPLWRDRKSTRLNSSHSQISYAVFCLKKKKEPVKPCPGNNGALGDNAHGNDAGTLLDVTAPVSYSNREQQTARPGRGVAGEGHPVHRV